MVYSFYPKTLIKELLFFQKAYMKNNVAELFDVYCFESLVLTSNIFEMYLQGIEYDITYYIFPI